MLSAGNCYLVLLSHSSLVQLGSSPRRHVSCSLELASAGQNQRLSKKTTDLHLSSRAKQGRATTPRECCQLEWRQTCIWRWESLLRDMDKRLPVACFVGIQTWKLIWRIRQKLWSVVGNSTWELCGTCHKCHEINNSFLPFKKHDLHKSISRRIKHISEGDNPTWTIYDW